MPVTAGFTVSVAVRLTMPYVAVNVTAVLVATAEVVTGNVVLVAPAATVALAGTVAATLERVKVTTAPPAGAAAVSVIVPVDDAPPTTLVGETVTVDRLAVVDVPAGVNPNAGENGPNTPAAFRARTRHHSCCAGRAPIEACDTLTIWFATNGAAIVDVSSTWIS